MCINDCLTLTLAVYYCWEYVKVFEGEREGKKKEGRGIGERGLAAGTASAALLYQVGEGREGERK